MGHRSKSAKAFVERKRAEKEARKAAELALTKAKTHSVSAEQEESQAEAERLVQEQAELELLALEQAGADRLAQEQAEVERLAKEQAEVERLALEQAELERLAKEQAEATERLALEQAEVERLALEQAELEHLAKEQAEVERLALEQAKADRLAQEQAELERLTLEQAEADRLVKEQENLVTENTADKNVTSSNTTQTYSTSTFDTVNTNTLNRADKLKESFKIPTERAFYTNYRSVDQKQIKEEHSEVSESLNWKRSTADEVSSISQAARIVVTEVLTEDTGVSFNNANTETLQRDEAKGTQSIVRETLKMPLNNENAEVLHIDKTRETQSLTEENKENIAGNANRNNVLLINKASFEKSNLLSHRKKQTQVVSEKLVTPTKQSENNKNDNSISQEKLSTATKPAVDNAELDLGVMHKDRISISMQKKIQAVNENRERLEQSKLKYSPMPKANIEGSKNTLGNSEQKLVLLPISDSQLLEETSTKQEENTLVEYSQIYSRLDNEQDEIILHEEILEYEDNPIEELQEKNLLSPLVKFSQIYSNSDKDSDLLNDEDMQLRLPSKNKLTTSAKNEFWSIRTKGLTTSKSSNVMDIFGKDYVKAIKDEILALEIKQISQKNPLQWSEKDFATLRLITHLDKGGNKKDFTNIINFEEQVALFENKEKKYIHVFDKLSDQPHFSAQDLTLCTKGVDVVADLAKLYYQPNLGNIASLIYDSAMFYVKLSNNNQMTQAVPLASLATTAYAAYQGEYTKVGINLINIYSHHLLTNDISSYSNHAFIGLNIIPIAHDLYKGEYILASVQTLGTASMLFNPSLVIPIYAIYYTGQKLYDLYQVSQQEADVVNGAKLCGIDGCSELEALKRVLDDCFYPPLLELIQLFLYD